jgi:Leucine-rich repeat (LRR) protein
MDVSGNFFISINAPTDLSVSEYSTLKQSSSKDEEGLVNLKLANFSSIPEECKSKVLEWVKMQIDQAAQGGERTLTIKGQECKQAYDQYEASVEIEMVIHNLALFFNNREQKELSIPNLSDIEELPDIFDHGCFAERLEIVDFSSSKGLKKIPESIGNCTALKKINLRNVYRLESIPESMGNCTGLENVILSGCSSLKKLPQEIGNWKKLKTLNISECLLLTNLPKSILGIAKVANIIQ